MGIVGRLTRHQLRRRGVALGALALIAALGVTGTLVAAGAADRTGGAYSGYLDRAHVGQVVINPSVVSRDIDRVVRHLPGVRSVTSDALFEAGIDRHPRPRTQADLDSDPEVMLLRGSTDGRYTTMDRPALTEGRLPTGRNEALVTAETARAKHLAIGDVLPLSFWSRRTELVGETGPVPPIGVERVTIVGIATLAGEVLPDGLYPRQTMIVSPDIARRYDCLPEMPPPGTPVQQVIFALAPQQCATSYRYYSLAVRGGTRGLTAALESFTKSAQRLTAELPQELRDQQVAYTLVAKTTTADEQRRVDRSTQPIVVALWVLAAAAAAITLLVLGLGIARELSSSDDDQVAWWRLGLTKRARALILAVPILGTVGVGLVVGTVAAWLLSPVAPIGNVRSIDPSPARELSGTTWLVVLGLALVVFALVGLLTWTAAGHVGTRALRRARPSAGRLGRGVRRPGIAEGLRAAYPTNRGVGYVLASGMTAVAAFVAAVVFGASLTSLLATPASYGWPWDVATVDNYGYGGIDLHAVRHTLHARDDVARWTALGFSNSIKVDHDAIPAVLGFDRSSSFDVPVVSGRLPTERDEIALGARTASDEGLGVGDHVSVSGYEVTARRARVTGIVVLPPLGPFQADRAAPGVGVLIPEAMLNRKQVSSLVSFVGVALRPSTDRASAFAELKPGFGSWDPQAITNLDFSRPVRPAEIIDARSMRSSPMLVGGLLVVGATIGLAVGIAMSVRARRRDLAVLRVLGFTRGQLRGSVIVQALALSTAAVVVGAPLGVVLGRAAWRAFASRLGVLTQPSVPLGWIVVTLVGAWVVAVLAAATPARSAARHHPASDLRLE